MSESEAEYEYEYFKLSESLETDIDSVLDILGGDGEFDELEVRRELVQNQHLDGRKEVAIGRLIDRRIPNVDAEPAAQIWPIVEPPSPALTVTSDDEAYYDALDHNNNNDRNKHSDTELVSNNYATGQEQETIGADATGDHEAGGDSADPDMTESAFEDDGSTPFGRSLFVEDRIEQLGLVFPGAVLDGMISGRLRVCRDEAHLGQVMNELTVQLTEYESHDDLPQSSTNQHSEQQPLPHRPIRRETLGPHVDEQIACKLSEEEKASSIQIVQMFPDADPNHIIRSIVQEGKTAHVLIDEMTRIEYPRLAHRMEKERVQHRRLEYLDRETFSVQHFLSIYPHPAAHFAAFDKDVSTLYKDHARVYLCNKYLYLQVPFIHRLLHEYKQHLLPTVDKIEAPDGVRRKGNDRSRLTVPASFLLMPQYQVPPRTELMSYPDHVDEQFYRELQYLTFRQLINDTINEQSKAREQRVLEVSAAGGLVECQCCFDDGVLPEEMVECRGTVDVHAYCTLCVLTHADTQVEEGNHGVKCIDGDCGAQFGLDELRSLLRPNVLNVMLRRAQQAEVRRAGLDNVETCPFCDFLMIMENDQQRVFRCHNPACLKESCRQCRQPSHIPLKCAENEGDAETRMRVFVENEMANALIRVCPKCDTRIVKTDGCNMMKCTCSTSFCYFCRKQVTGYDHFGGDLQLMFAAVAQRSCPLYTSIDQVNTQVAREAGRKAQQKFLVDNPDLRQTHPNVGNAVNVESLVDTGDGDGRAPANAMFANFERLLGMPLENMLVQMNRVEAHHRPRPRPAVARAQPVVPQPQWQTGRGVVHRARVQVPQGTPEWLQRNRAQERAAVERERAERVRAREQRERNRGNAAMHRLEKARREWELFSERTEKEKGWKR